MVLAVRNLHKTFVLHAIEGRHVTALRGVDLDVEAGAHVALAGPSGAGKSSLLKCVYRTYLPTSGAVMFAPSTGPVVDLTRLDDREVTVLRGQEIGYVSQFLRAEPRRSTLDVVANAGVRRGMQRDEAIAAARTILARVGLEPTLWAVYPSVLSGGEKQRVNLAAGVISPPRLLLLDEPISALDPANKESVLQLIDELTTHGVAVLSVFHDMDAIARVATKVVWMSDGAVVASGTPADVLERVQ
ncbi:MAG: phosphonate C-P lyase system protein PhnL [Acidimicrobiia bacterium]